MVTLDLPSICCRVSLETIFFFFTHHGSCLTKFLTDLCVDSSLAFQEMDHHDLYFGTADYIGRRFPPIACVTKSKPVTPFSFPHSASTQHAFPPQQVHIKSSPLRFYIKKIIIIIIIVELKILKGRGLILLILFWMRISFILEKERKKERKSAWSFKFLERKGKAAHLLALLITLIFLLRFNIFPLSSVHVDTHADDGCGRSDEY